MYLSSRRIARTLSLAAVAPTAAISLSTLRREIKRGSSQIASPSTVFVETPLLCPASVRLALPLPVGGRCDHRSPRRNGDSVCHGGQRQNQHMPLCRRSSDRNSATGQRCHQRRYWNRRGVENIPGVLSANFIFCGDKKITNALPLKKIHAISS
jgi:hypothetical protein